MRLKSPILPLIVFASLSLLIPVSRAETPSDPSDPTDGSCFCLSHSTLTLHTAFNAPASPLPPTSPIDDLTHPLTVNQKLTLVVHRTFGPPGFVIPAFEAGIAMADPPPRFPPEWHDGAEGFGHLYGAFFTRHVVGNAAEFAFSTAFHEDPRYFPERAGHNGGHRILHAVWFSFYNETDSGHRFFALNNFAGAAAAGFVGTAYQPAGFNDLTHAGQRTTTDFSTYIGRNLISEFSPELGHIFRKFHMRVPNNDHPLWWNSNR
jgi:hypothetical protein